MEKLLGVLGFIVIACAFLPMKAQEHVVSTTLNVTESEPLDSSFFNHTPEEEKRAMHQGTDASSLDDHIYFVTKFFEKNMREVWQHDKLVTLAEQVKSIITVIKKDLETINHTLDDFETFDDACLRALHFYNLLRQSLGFATASSTKMIEYSWLAELEHESTILSAVQKAGLVPAPLAIVDLLDQEQQSAGIKENLLPFTYAHAEESTSMCARCPYAEDVFCIALNANWDLDYKLFEIYLALAYIFLEYHHIFSLINERRVSPELFLQTESFQKDLKNYVYFVELGKKAFNDTTSLGRHIQQEIVKNNKLGNPLSRQEIDPKMLLIKSLKRQAFSFTIDNLLNKNKLSSLISGMHHFAFPAEKYASSSPNNLLSKMRSALSIFYQDYLLGTFLGKIHLNISLEALELILYMAGVLVDRGIDLEAELKAWEQHGQCMSIEDILRAATITGQSVSRTFRQFIFINSSSPLQNLFEAIPVQGARVFITLAPGLSVEI